MNHIKQTRLLWEIQSLEKELKQLEVSDDCKQMREEIKSLKQLLMKQQQALKVGKDEFDNLQAELSILQDKVTKAEGVCALDQQELYQANSNHKEVEALFHKEEVDMANYRKVQEEYLVLAEKKEKMNRQLAKNLRIFRQNKELYQRLNEQLQKQQAKKDELIKQKQQTLVDTLGVVEADWLSRYQGLSQEFPLTAVAQVKKGVCSACYLGLSFDNLRQALKVEAPIYCEHCGRLLYFTTEELQQV